MIVMPVVRWWLLLELLGLVGLPISMRLLWHLPECGVVFRRTLGTVLPAMVFWILISTGFLQNTTAAAAFSVCLVGAVSIRIALRHGSELLETLRRLRRTVLLEEVLFVASLVLFALFRAYNPEIVGTEKPMEFAFLNGILQSRTFPPQDPWLAGYSISYYYFGYLVAALLTRLSALASDVTFNLTGITLFALTVSGSFALVYDLALAGGQGQRAPSRGPARAGLLGAVLVAVMGNLEGVLELVRAHGLGSEALWRWFDVRNLGSTPPSATWYPDDTWWWWRASRVIHDRDLLGNAQEVISEFPFFSFLLGDNHPHVLALPLVLLVLALALNTLLSRHGDAPEAAGARQGNGDGWLALAWHAWPHGPGQLVITGLLLGALAFTNTWDYPVYFAVFIAALALARYPGRSNVGSWLQEVLLSSVALVAVTVVGYLPFFLSLRSQEGGIGLVPPHTKTAIQQFLLMFGVQIVLVVGFLTAVSMRLRAAWSEHQAPTLALIWAGACGLLALAALGVCWWTSSLCLVIIGSSGGLLVAGAQLWADDRAGAPAAATLFALLLVTVAMLLLLSVEFVFLRDVFGTRMNTVFKFYYQGWVLLSLSSAYGVWYVLSRQAAGFATALRSAWLVLGAVLVLVASAIRWRLRQARPMVFRVRRRWMARPMWRASGHSSMP